jgi:hypothetical protein
MTMAWGVLALFMLTVLAASLYGLAAAGHFPAEHRPPALQGAGAAILWLTLLATVVAVVVVLIAAVRGLPWYALVIGGGLMLLAAPLVLQPFPDRLVNGRAGLLLFALTALLAAAALVVAAR